MKRIAWESLDARERTQALRRPAQQASAGTSAAVAALIDEVRARGDAAVRFWAIVGLRVAFPKDEALLEDLYDAMDDVDVAVRIETAAWMADFSSRQNTAACCGGFR